MNEKVSQYDDGQYCYCDSGSPDVVSQESTRHLCGKEFVLGLVCGLVLSVALLVSIALTSRGLR